MSPARLLPSLHLSLRSGRCCFESPVLQALVDSKPLAVYNSPGHKLARLGFLTTESSQQRSLTPSLQEQREETQGAGGLFPPSPKLALPTFSLLR